MGEEEEAHSAPCVYGNGRYHREQNIKSDSQTESELIAILKQNVTVVFCILSPEILNQSAGRSGVDCVQDIKLRVLVGMHGSITKKPIKFYSKERKNKNFGW